jgi:hypothetical protein
MCRCRPRMRPSHSIIPVCRLPIADCRWALYCCAFYNLRFDSFHGRKEFHSLLRTGPAGPLSGGNIISLQDFSRGLHRCVREHLPHLQKRNIRSSNILAVFQQHCFVPQSHRRRATTSANLLPAC